MDITGFYVGHTHFALTVVHVLCFLVLKSAEVKRNLKLENPTQNS